MKRLLLLREVTNYERLQISVEATDPLFNVLVDHSKEWKTTQEIRSILDQNIPDLPHLPAGTLSRLGRFAGFTINWRIGFECPRSDLGMLISVALRSLVFSLSLDN